MTSCSVDVKAGLETQEEGTEKKPALPIGEPIMVLDTHCGKMGLYIQNAVAVGSGAGEALGIVKDREAL